MNLASIVWGGDAYPVSQPFGVYNAELAGWYDYAKHYGHRAGTHIGLDVAVPKFTPIYASQSGTVQAAGWSDSFRPNPVTIKEADGDEAIYGHLWSNSVATGQRVKRGQLIGYSGEQTQAGTLTPDGSGPHIHYELRRPDALTGGMIAVDPVPELTGGIDMGHPGNDYAENPYDLMAWGMPDAETIERGGARVMLAIAGGALAIVGAWVLLGAPTSVLGLVKG